MSYQLLSEPIRRYIRDKRWEALRAIQVAAIPRILESTKNYILVSRTASGKTEAAFLPILSKVDFQGVGVKVLYISPLIALINDQFERVEELCRYMDVTITKWHGEANRSQKENLKRSPSGIVLITPESIEALFVNAPSTLGHLFSHLEYVIIDEIHSFLGTDRGNHLKSLLSRLQDVNANKFSIVGLSATLSNYQVAKEFTGDVENTSVLVDKDAKPVNISIRFFPSETTELSTELMDDLFLQIKNKKVLIFPNSRGRVEEIAVKLKKLSSIHKEHQNFFSHHSSVERELREYAEKFAKASTRESFAIVCTSTLELGIDIGSVNEVVQVDATFSIASLIQRLGRSGRRKGEQSVLCLYATDVWSLLQSLACWELYKLDFIEPIPEQGIPYDIVVHQILSIVKEKSGRHLNELINVIERNKSFVGVSKDDIVSIIQELIRVDLLENLQGELIIGITGERIVNSKDFYSVFKTEPNLKVVFGGKQIGEIPFSPQIREDENILLAAKIWKIIYVDLSSKRIEVKPALDGKKPTFFGSAGNVHARIRKEMFEILLSSNIYAEVDDQGMQSLNELRDIFSQAAISNRETQRPVYCGEKDKVLFTFESTIVNRSFFFLLKQINCDCLFDDSKSCFYFSSDLDIQPIIEKCRSILPETRVLLGQALNDTPELLDFSKWGVYLPRDLQITFLLNRYFDFSSTEIFLKQIQLVNVGIPFNQTQPS